MVLLLNNFGLEAESKIPVSLLVCQKQLENIECFLVIILFQLYIFLFSQQCEEVWASINVWDYEGLGLWRFKGAKCVNVIILMKIEIYKMSSLTSLE